MVIQRPLTLSSAVLACIGLALIVAGFLLLVPSDRRSAIAWLDLAVCGAVFLVNFSNLPLVRPKVEGFSGSIPRLGVLWTTHALYTCLALAGMWYGWAALSFRFQLVYQAALLFGLLVAVSTAGKASEHAVAVAQSEQRLTDSLQTLKSAVADCETAFLRAGAGRGPEFSDFQRIKEDVRYLSPCSSPTAVSLDLEIACLLGDLCAALPSTSQFSAPGQSVNETLTRCRTLVQLRRQERQL